MKNQTEYAKICLGRVYHLFSIKNISFTIKRNSSNCFNVGGQKYDEYKHKCKKMYR